MKGIIYTICFVIAFSPLYAEEGFYISLGLGSDMFFGERMPSETLPVTIFSNGQLRQATTDIVTTDLGAMFAMDFNMGYNIMNYASIELKFNFTGSDIFTKGERKGGGFISAVAKYHPINHWRLGYFIDPYIFLGGGYSMIGVNVEEAGFAEKQSKAVAGGLFETGIGSDFYIKKWFSIFLDLNFYFPFYSKFYYDWEKDITHNMKDTPSTTVFALIVGSRFHFNIKE